MNEGIKPFDFRPFEEHYNRWEAQFRSGEGPGDFSFKAGGPTSLYGSTDMVFNRAIMGALDLSSDQRQQWARCINSFQDLRTGWYRKKYTLHFKEHGTAYAAAALKLLGASPARPVEKCLDVVRSQEAMEKWLKKIPWSIIWPSSHIVTGLPAIIHMFPREHGGDQADSFFEAYFRWLDDTAEPSTGFWTRGVAHRLGMLKKSSMEAMGGAFHMYFIYQARGRTWPFCRQIVDATLSLQKANGFWDGDYTYCIDLDGVYSILRSSAHAGGYRKDDVYNACLRYLASAALLLNHREQLFHHYTNSHRLPGALSAIAECALHFPELVKTGRPWVQTLDEACFI
jgi:hypothetical protein